jgi:hypothetical protein
MYFDPDNLTLPAGYTMRIPNSNGTFEVEGSVYYIMIYTYKYMVLGWKVRAV